MDALYDVFLKDKNYSNDEILSYMWQFNKIEQNVKKELLNYDSIHDMFRNTRVWYLLMPFESSFTI